MRPEPDFAQLQQLAEERGAERLHLAVLELDAADQAIARCVQWVQPLIGSPAAAAITHGRDARRHLSDLQSSITGLRQALALIKAKGAPTVSEDFILREFERNS